MPPASRISDNTQGTPHCHSVHPWSPVPHPNTGPIIKGSPNVLTNFLPQARVSDQGVHAACCGPNTYKITKGSGTVKVNSLPAARLGDMTQHCGSIPGMIIAGSPNVIIGG